MLPKKAPIIPKPHDPRIPPLALEQMHPDVQQTPQYPDRFDHGLTLKVSTL
jgi:hypothetical protein